MTEHCARCKGTGKVRDTETFDLVACLDCTGTGIEPEKAKPAGRTIIGPFHTYRGMKRDAIIIVGLVILLFIVRANSG